MRHASIASALVLLAAAGADASPKPADNAFMAACVARGGEVARSQCECLERELQHTLSDAEFAVELSAMRGDTKAWDKALAAMGAAKADDFQTRVNGAMDRCPAE